LEAVLALAPIVEQRLPIEPDHVRQRASLRRRFGMSEAKAAKQTQNVVLAFSVHLAQRLLVGKLGDLDDQPFAQGAELRRQTCEGALRDGVDVAEGRRP